MELRCSGQHSVAFGADGGVVAVAGVHDGVIGQGQQAVADTAQDGGLVAVAAPGGAWAATEERVAAEYYPVGDIVEVLGRL